MNAVMLVRFSVIMRLSVISMDIMGTPAGVGGRCPQVLSALQLWYFLMVQRGQMSPLYYILGLKLVWSCHRPLFKFCNPLCIFGIDEALHFKFRMQTGHGRFDFGMTSTR